MVKIGLIGDLDESIPAHRAIPIALGLAEKSLGTSVDVEWVATDTIEYARHVLGWQDAEHAETAPEASMLVIAPLHCALVEETGSVLFRAGSRLRAAYGTDQSTEGYRCSYGLNPAFQASLVEGPLHGLHATELGRASR